MEEYYVVSGFEIGCAIVYVFIIGFVLGAITIIYMGG